MVTLQIICSNAIMRTCVQLLKQDIQLLKRDIVVKIVGIFRKVHSRKPFDLLLKRVNVSDNNDNGGRIDSNFNQIQQQGKLRR